MPCCPCGITCFFPYRCIAAGAICSYYCKAVTLPNPLIKFSLVVIGRKSMPGHPCGGVRNFLENNSVEVLAVHSIGAYVGRFITLLCPFGKFSLIIVCGKAMPGYPNGVRSFFKQRCIQHWPACSIPA